MTGTRERRRGQALIMVTLAIVMILGMLSLTVDLGWMRFRQEAAQSAAEAAAMAAIQAAIASSGGSFVCGSNNVGCQSATLCPNPLVVSPKNSIDVACAYANSNGFAVTTGGRQSVYVAAGAGSAPPTAPGAVVSYWVTVTVAESVPQFFGGILGNTTGSASARSTAAAVNSGAPASCLYTLDPTMKSALSVSGAATVTATCGVFVNSNFVDPLKKSGAVSVSGSGRIISTQVMVVGGVYIDNSGSTITPTPVTGSAVTPDPFGSLPAPTYSGCNYLNKSVGNGLTVTLSPGVYCNGLNLAGGSTVTLQPGMYVMNGGGLIVGGGAKVSGSGVTVFNTSNGYTYQPINIAGGTTVTLSGPSSGTYKGVLFYTDRNINSASMNIFSGGTAVQLTGSLYFPSTPVTYNGGSASTVTAILAKSAVFSGGASYMAYDPTGAKTGLSSVAARMVE